MEDICINHAFIAYIPLYTFNGENIVPEHCVFGTCVQQSSSSLENVFASIAHLKKQLKTYSSPFTSFSFCANTFFVLQERSNNSFLFRRIIVDNVNQIISSVER